MIIPRSPESAPILGIAAQLDAAGYYRIVVPMRAVGGSWATIATMTQEQVDSCHTVVISRLSGAEQDVFKFIRHLKRLGKRVLVDYDDAMFMRHPVTEVRMSLALRRSIKVALTEADGVIVTGHQLKKYFRRYTKLPIYIVPNLIIPHDWPEPSPWDSPPVIVMAGSPSHKRDWDIAVEALAFIRKSAPDVQLRLLGCEHDLLKQIATQGGHWFSDVGEYRNALRGGMIGVCPLPYTRFNECKTPVKLIEYAMSGLAVIGSPTQYEKHLSEHGIIVTDDDPRGWAIGIASYLANPRMARDKANDLRSYVSKTFDAMNHHRELIAVYSEGSQCLS